MKKVGLFASLIAASSIAAAQSFVGIELAPLGIKDRTTGVETQSVTAKVGTTLGKATVDVLGSANRTEKTAINSQTIQGRIAYDFGPAWVRGGVGQQLDNGSNYNFYTYAVGTSYNATKDLALIGSVEKTVARDAARTDFLTTSLGFDYTVAPKHIVGVVYQYTDGDVKAHAVKTGYTYKF